MRNFVLTWLLILAGCTGQQPDPPAIAELESELEATLVHLQRMEAGLDADLSSMGLAVDDLKSITLDGIAASRDFFKHVSMACINERASLAASSPSPEIVEASERLGIQCKPHILPSFHQHLSEQSAIHREEVLEKLLVIDDLRESRERIQGRISQMRPLALRTRLYIENRRAQARQMELDIERRRAEYSRAGLQEALQVVRHWRTRLDELEAAVERIEERADHWSDALNDVLRQVYIAVSLL